MRLIKSAFLFTLVATLATMPMLSVAKPGELVLVKKFSVQDGAIEFLPGAWVSSQDGKSVEYYHFDGKAFAKAKELPALLRGWRSYSGSADYIDQISRKDFDPAIQHLLPKLSKVKKVVDVIRSNSDIVYVCYTLAAEDSDVEPSSTDVFLAIFKSKMTGLNTTFELLNSVKLEADAAYGDLSVQNIPDFGSFLAFYWSEPTANSSVDGLDVYKID